MILFIEFLGKQTISFFHGFGEIVILFSQTWKALLKGKINFILVIEQIKKIGFESMPVIIFTSFFMGMVIAFSTGVYLNDKLTGVGSFTGLSVTVSFVREIGPVLTALLIAGRSGSSVAAEIGTMIITEQVDAMKTMAIKPVHYLIVPRVLAGTLSLPILTWICDFVAILGGAVIAHIYLDQTFAQYSAYAVSALTLDLVLLGSIKSLVFGFFIIFISSAKGYLVSGGADSVGKATTQAVVAASIATVILDFIITSLDS